MFRRFRLVEGFVLRFLTWRTWVGVLLSLTVGVSASAQDSLTSFQRAQKTAEAGGWTRARAIFQEIAQTDPDLPEAAWNAAFLARKTEQWESCVLYFRFYLERVPEASDKDETESTLAYCERKVENRGSIDVKAEPEDATIFIDGIALTEGFLDRLVLSAGKHDLRVERMGYDTHSERIDVTSGVNSEFSITLHETVYQGTLVVNVDQDDALVRIDGQDVGTTPLPEDGIRQRAEKKVLLTVDKDGYRQWQRYITLQPDSTYELDITMLRDLD